MAEHQVIQLFPSKCKYTYVQKALGHCDIRIIAKLCWNAEQKYKWHFIILVQLPSTQDDTG